MKRLVENNLYVKLEKYKWKMQEVGFLEVVIGPEGIKIEEEKIKDVLDWPIPQEVENVQNFLRLVNYYYQFVKDFTVIARPLYDMVKKDQKWKWIERQEEVFRKFKERFTKELVLAALDLDLKKVDILYYTIEEILSIKCEDKRWKPVAFLLKFLNKTERNYKIHDKKMLAIIRELENWRHLLESVKFKFEVWTDHKNLEYFMKMQKLNRR